MNLDQPLHLQIRTARKQQGLTQVELAKRAYMKQSEISQLENGKDVRLSSLRRVVLALNMSLQLVAKFPVTSSANTVSSDLLVEDEVSDIFKRFEVPDDEK